MESLKTIELHWYGPYSFSELLLNSENKNKFSKPGVYLMVERKQNRLCYVGRTLSNLVSRQRDHNAKQIGGLYTVPKEYRKSATCDWIPNHNENVDTLFSLERFLKLVTEAFEYRNDIDIYLCPLNEERKMLKAIELNLLFSLQPHGTKWGKLSPPKSRVDIVHVCAGWKESVDENQRSNIVFC